MIADVAALELADGLPLRTARAIAAEARRAFVGGPAHPSGPDHWARVAAAGEWIVRRLGPAHADLAPAVLGAVELFALAHDCLRGAAGVDRAHGRSAAQWLIAQFGAAAPEGVRHAAAACAAHQHLPDDLGGPIPVPLSVRVCLDANRLDAARPGVGLPIVLVDLFTPPPRQPGGIERARAYAAGRHRWWLDRWGFFALPARCGRPPIRQEDP